MHGQTSQDIFKIQFGQEYFLSWCSTAIPQSQGDSLKKGRGKPTRSFILNPRFLEALQVLPETGSLQSYFEALQRKSALLGMLSNLCMETFERSTESDISKEDIDLQDHFPMYLYTVNSTQEMERYREMLVDAIQEARRCTEDLDAEHSENMKYIVFTGYVPVFETGRS